MTTYNLNGTFSGTFTGDIEVVNTIPQANLVGWFDATDSATITLDTNNKVSNWTNKAPAGLSAYNTIATSRPTVQAMGINGLNTIRFNASSSQFLIIDHNSTLDFDSGTGLSIFGVYKNNGYIFQGSTFDSIFSKNNSSTTESGYSFYTDQENTSNFKTGANPPADISIANTFLSTPIGFALERNNSNATAYMNLNGTTANGAANTSGDNTNPFLIGGDFTGTRYKNMDLAEFIIYQGYVDSATRAAVQNYLANKYGVSF